MAKDLIEVVHKIRHYHPLMKIIVSEVTPRQIFRDDEVKKCNLALHSSLLHETNVTLAFHSNLRNDEWTFHKKNDDKHFSRISISLFAANLKDALRRSIGIHTRKYEKNNHGTRGGNGIGSANKNNNIRKSKSLKYPNDKGGRHNDRSDRRNDNSDRFGGERHGRDTDVNIRTFKQDLINFLTTYKV